MWEVPQDGEGFLLRLAASLGLYSAGLNSMYVLQSFSTLYFRISCLALTLSAIVNLVLTMQAHPGFHCLIFLLGKLQR